MRIVVDVMGGDHGCGVVVGGVKLALHAYARISEIHLVGDQERIRAALAEARLDDNRVHVHHASQVLSMEDKPLTAIRRKKDSSIVRAVELLKDGKGQALISPGNTGGLVAAATFGLHRLEGVERPAIATILPSAQNEFVLVDSGAFPECKPFHLAQFAVMGSVYSRHMLGYASPRVGVLSNGTEDYKGTDLTRETYKLLKQLDLNFIGYVEGHDLFADRVEVVVTDGFVGNVVLKTCESMGKAILGFVKRGITATPIRKFGALLARGAFDQIRTRMDPDAYGGAPVLGVNGNVIKAHGSAREKAIMNAIRVSMEAIEHQVSEIIQREITAANTRLAAAVPPATSPVPA